MGKHYEHLSFAERVFIQLSLERQSRPIDIAISLERPPCTISRELSRSGWVNPSKRPVQRGRPAIAGGYRAVSAPRRWFIGQGEKTKEAGQRRRSMAASGITVARLPLTGTDFGYTQTHEPGRRYAPSQP